MFWLLGARSLSLSLAPSLPSQKQMRVALASLLSMPLLAAADAGACAAATTCGACAAVLDHGCFWCYDSGACMALQYPTSSGGVLNGCHNFSMTAPDCACNVFKTCSECATPAHIAHPACEWTNTSTNLTIHGGTWIGDSTVSLGHRVGCRVAGVAGAFTGPDKVTHNQSIALPGMDPISIAIVEYPTRWYWAQCNVEGPGECANTPWKPALSLCAARLESSPCGMPPSPLELTDAPLSTLSSPLAAQPLPAS